MNFEVIKKEVNYKAPTIFCFHCKKTDCKNYTYAMLKNTYYCEDCFKDLHNINSALDEKLIEIEKNIVELQNGMIDKNIRLRQTDNFIEILLSFMKNLGDFEEEEEKKE